MGWHTGFSTQLLIMPRSASVNQVPGINPPCLFTDHTPRQEVHRTAVRLPEGPFHRRPRIPLLCGLKHGSSN